MWFEVHAPSWRPPSIHHHSYNGQYSIRLIQALVDREKRRDGKQRNNQLYTTSSHAGSAGASAPCNDDAIPRSLLSKRLIFINSTILMNLFDQKVVSQTDIFILAGTGPCACRHKVAFIIPITFMALLVLTPISVRQTRINFGTIMASCPTTT